RKIQIKREGRAIQRGLYFLDESLNDRLTVSKEIDRRNARPFSFQPNAAFIGTLVAALKFGNFRRRHGVFADRQQVTTEIVDGRYAAAIRAAQKEMPAKSHSCSWTKVTLPSFDLV